jgi:transposase-like protein
MISFPLELMDSQGNLERPFPAGPWRLPARIDLDGDRLVWTQEPSRLIRPQTGGFQGLFEKFIELGDASAQKILAYARHWGMLELCEHDFPANHPQGCWPVNPPLFSERVIKYPAGFAVRVTACAARGSFEGQRWEPVESWRLWARRARATLNVAAQLHRGKIGEEEDWRVTEGAEEIPYFPEDWPMPKGVEEGWGRLIYYLNHWLWFTRVRPRLEWDQGRPVVTLGGGQLFGTLAVQLMLAISRTDGLEVCSGCGLGYIPHRRPKAEQRHYCLECRKRKVPQRDAARDMRKRKDKADRLMSQGIPLGEVARRLDRDVETVRQWRKHK